MKLHDYLPDLTPAYNALLAFVKEHQGEKGFIRTDDDSCDTIWSFIYSDALSSGVEQQVLAVRAVDNNLEVCLSYSEYSYKDEFTDDDFKCESNWYDLRLSDVYYRETLYNILENIEEYV